MDLFDVIIWVFRLVVIGLVGFASWRAFRAFQQRRFVRAAFLALPLACILLAWWLPPWMIAQENFGVFTPMDSAVASYYSERSFHGDGYTIRAHPLPPRVAHRFREEPERTGTYPCRGDREGWEAYGWRPAPVEAQLMPAVDFALGVGYATGAEAAVEDSLQAEVLEALSRKTTWYAVFQKQASWGVVNVDLYVVDLEGQRFYLINHNT